MATQTNTRITESTCDNPDCSYSGREFYVRDGQHLCGRCLDKEDDQNMPFMVSEFSFRILREVEDR